MALNYLQALDATATSSTSDSKLNWEKKEKRHFECKALFNAQQRMKWVKRERERESERDNKLNSLKRGIVFLR